MEKVFRKKKKTNIFSQVCDDLGTTTDTFMMNRSPRTTPPPDVREGFPYLLPIFARAAAREGFFIIIARNHFCRYLRRSRSNFSTSSENDSRGERRFFEPGFPRLFANYAVPLTRPHVFETTFLSHKARTHRHNVTSR